MVNKSGMRKKVLSFTHGYGGAAPVTKGTIQTASSGCIPYQSADIVVSGPIYTNLGRAWNWQGKSLY